MIDVRLIVGIFLALLWRSIRNGLRSKAFWRAIKEGATLGFLFGPIVPGCYFAIVEEARNDRFGLLVGSVLCAITFGMHLFRVFFADPLTNVQRETIEMQRKAIEEQQKTIETLKGNLNALYGRTGESDSERRIRKAVNSVDPFLN